MSDHTMLAAHIQKLAALPQLHRADVLAVVDELRAGLNDGSIRAASPSADGWHVNSWVKAGILLGFRIGIIEPVSPAGPMQFYDKDTWPVRDLSTLERFRAVPGGTSVRDGSYLGSGVTIMPPAYINVGAYVGSGTMIDSHALVGSCAQIGERVHLSAAAQIGGVLEPVGAMPVIVEDDALIGGNTGLYEGVQVGRGAVLAAGVILTRSQRIYDLVHDTILRADDNGVLRVPERAVVVLGSRPASGAFAKLHNLQLTTPIIVKYRDERTDAATALEEALR